MAVPGFQSFMLPLLNILRDGKEHNLDGVRELLASQFHLNEKDRNELLPSGRNFVFNDRVHWAQAYLKKALLLENPSRAKLRITKRGQDVLSSNPIVIDREFLRRFPEFIAFEESSTSKTNKQQRHEESGQRTDKLEKKFEEPDQTPEELLESSYQKLRRDLAQELLERIKQCSPRFFENLVVDLLVAMGYGGSRKDAGQAIGQSGDEGVDGIIKEDKLGLDIVYIQAKRWEGPVGRPTVQSFSGSLDGQRAKKGVLITTSRFSQEALDYVPGEKKIVLINGEQLAQFMIDHGIGVTEVASYVVKKIDSDYFDED